MSAAARDRIAAAQRKRWREARRAQAPQKGFNYKGRHWTQLPENKSRLRAMAKNNSLVRLAKKAGVTK
jgi:hypothetical protein